AVAMPAIVAGATAGAARMFAGTAHGVACPKTVTSSGVQASCAAAGTATATATARGMRRDSRLDQEGATSTMAAVATTDSAKPTDRARKGSTRTSRSTAPDSNGSGCERRPIDTAMSAITPIVAARRTLGEGRASTTNAARLAAATAVLAPRRSGVRRTTAPTVASTMAQFSPLTALRWVSPLTLNAFVNDAGIADTSPTT